MLRMRLQCNITMSTSHQLPSRNSFCFPIYTDQMREAEVGRKQEKETLTPIKVRRNVKNLLNGIRKESETNLQL